MFATQSRGHRRTMPVLLILGLVLAVLPAGAALGDARDIDDDLCSPPYEADFDDIAGSAHEELIRCMADLDLTEGVGDNRYAPRRDVTRGQMASFVARFLVDYTGKPLPEGDPDRFDDVPQDDSAYPHSTSIHSLAEIEVVDGTSASGGDSYAPQAGVTRAQMASMIRRALAWADDGDARNDSAPPAGEQDAFTDTAGSIHEDNIDSLADVGIVQGFGDDTYRPSNLVKRDQMASFVMRSYDYAVEEIREDDPDAPTVSIGAPTSGDPAQANPGEEFDVEFTSKDAAVYAIDFSDGDDWATFGGDAADEVEDGETTATVRVPNGTDPGTYDIRVSVVGEGGASSDVSTESLIVPEPGPVTIISPSTDDPEFPVADEGDVDITFQTDRAGDYELEFRDPDPDPDTFLGFPIGGNDGPGDWESFDGDGADGSVGSGEHTRTVTLPDDAGDEGVRDIRLTFTPDDSPTTTISHRQDAALIVGDGVVINLTEGRIDFEIQEAVDNADEGHVLLAVGVFDETVEVDKDDLMLSGVGEDTVLDGTIIVEGVSGVMVSDLTITEYDTLSLLGLGLIGDEIGVLVDDATGIVLDRLRLEGSGSVSDDVGVETRDDVGVTITRSTFTDNDRGVSVTGGGEHVVIGDGNHFSDNLHGIFVEEDGQLTTISDSEFVDNQRGIRVDGPDVTIDGNTFEGNGAGGVRLSEEGRFATVVENEFLDTGGDHLRFFTTSYPSGYADTVVDDNTFAPDHEVVTSGNWTVIRPENESEENDD